MKLPKESKRIVVDTSVIKAAGDGAHPAKICRDVLDTIYKVCHRVVLTESMATEWRRHPSRHYIGWRNQMVGKKKLIVLPDRLESDTCRKVLAAVDEQNRNVVAKDIMLLEAALETDRIVISLDSRTGRHIAKAAQEMVKEVQNVQWENLKRSEPEATEAVLEWLRCGANHSAGRAGSERTLGHVHESANVE